MDLCEDNCRNFDGGFECSCREGFRLDNDGITCHGIKNLVFPALHDWKSQRYPRGWQNG